MCAIALAICNSKMTPIIQLEIRISSSKAFLIKNKIKNRFATAFLMKPAALLAYRENDIFGEIFYILT